MVSRLSEQYAISHILICAIVLHVSFIVLGVVGKDNPFNITKRFAC